MKDLRVGGLAVTPKVQSAPLRRRRRHAAVRLGPHSSRAPRAAATPAALCRTAARRERLGAIAVQAGAYGVIVALLLSNRLALLQLLQRLWAGG
ncbi:MAG: hypothetical protein KGJ55_11895 [Gammaproteobacteria bacterium]|nr:hypothetical protein [Gammaproteobacteria bacterium]